MVVAVNMMDEVRRQGIDLDIDVLAEHLGVPVVPISARTVEGLPELQNALYQVIRHPVRPGTPHISFPPVLEEAIKNIARKIERSSKDRRLDQNFLALQLLEDARPDDVGQDDAVGKALQSWRRRVE